MTARVWKLVKRFDGTPKESDLNLVEEALPAVSDNEILIEALFFSVDPYMRPFSNTLPLGSTMIGEQVAKIVESKHSDFKKDQIVLASVGWRDKTVVNPVEAKVIPAWNTGKFPVSYALGLLGMPGLSSLLGFIPICDPKPGETLFVNSSAGTVGSIVGMIGKIKGCKVIGCAGTEDKVKYVKEECKFDEVFNYKTCDLNTTLKKLAPNGIDCYFDNVGGKFSAEVIINHMNPSGRISCCGNLSGYNAKNPELGPMFSFSMVAKELSMKGFMVYSYQDKYPEAAKQLLEWATEGKIKIKENVVKGFENIPSAFIGLLNGDYHGKVVIQA